MYFDCIVVGGGPAGMMAAIASARNQNKTALLEHGKMVGKKILSTGNGRCNLTNEKMDERCYYCDEPNFVRQVLAAFNQQDTCDFFRSIGVFTKSRNGYVYPVCDQAAVIREALENQLYYAQVTTLCETEIQSVEKKENFVLQTSRGIFTCKSLILATGSKAAPKTGSDGSGYALCRQLGLQMNKVLPALTALKSSEEFCPKLAGVRADAAIRLWIDGEEDKGDLGEIQFTEYGISGIPVFQVSHQAVRSLDKGQKVLAEFNLLPQREDTEIRTFLRQGRTDCPGISLLQWCSGMLNKKLANVVLVQSGIPKEGISMRKLTDAQMEKLIAEIQHFSMKISGYQGFEYGQVCSGGVKISQLDARTMACKKLPGLYLAGEIIDADGICGGYNLQWAFSTGFIAGTHAGMERK